MINYGLIQESIDFYEKKGFKRIESPWTVTKEISNITKPPDAGNFTIIEKNKVLVASGEQSFLYLINKGFLPPGKYQTVTPCFRDEPFDESHTKYFVKNELIITDDVSKKQLSFIVNSAREFFRKYCLLPKKDDSYLLSTNQKDDVIIVDTVNCRNQAVDNVDENDPYRWPHYDLIYRGIELGSYGIRYSNFGNWIYGTGLAEPRFSRFILNQY